MRDTHALTADGADDGEPQPATVSRRRLLGSMAGATVGASSVGFGTESASATDFTGCTDWLEAPAAFPEVDLTDEEPTTSTLEPIEDADEIVVYVHGWLGLKTSTDQAYTLEQALEANDYDQPVLAASWAADTANYWRAEGRTETAGERLASWLESDHEALEETTVRLVGHSLGGRLCLGTLRALEDVSVETVSLLGTAADDDAVCTDGRYADDIDAGAAAVYNYHSEDDDSVCYGYDVQSLASGLGCAGSDCAGGWFGNDSGEPPENYTDVDVTDAVDDHCDYAKPEVGCVNQLVDDIE